MPDTRFQPGNTLNSRRKHHGGGRPPRLITVIQDEIEQHPNRVRVCLDKIYSLAVSGDNKVALAACQGYLDRIGMRMPKQSSLTVQGMVSVGTPEDYRRAAMLLAHDKEQEQLLLNGPFSLQPVEVNEPADSTG